jgi:hypothetical protein
LGKLESGEARRYLVLVGKCGKVDCSSTVRKREGGCNGIDLIRQRCILAVLRSFEVKIVAVKRASSSPIVVLELVTVVDCSNLDAMLSVAAATCLGRAPNVKSQWVWWLLESSKTATSDKDCPFEVKRPLDIT